MTSDKLYAFITDLSVPGIDKDRYIVTVGGVIFDFKMQRHPKTFIDQFGYEKIHLHTKDGFKIVHVHRIVAIELCGYSPDPERIQIDHKDCTKNNNGLYNLEWVTPHENTHRALRNNLCSHINCVVSDDDVRFICEQLKLGKSYGEISDMLYPKTQTNLRTVIGNIYRGQSWENISKDYLPFPDKLDTTYYKGKRVIPSNSILTESMIHEICQRLEAGERSMDIAQDLSDRTGKDFDKLESAIGGIRQRKSYTSISSQYNVPRGSNCKKRSD